MTPPTAVTIPAVNVWRAPRAPSQPSESPAPNVTDILGAKCVSRTTSTVPRIRNPFVSARDAARPVERSREATRMHVTNDIVTRVNRTERFGICAI